MKCLIECLALSLAATSLPAQQNAPKILADFDASFLKLNYEMNLGEVLGVAVKFEGNDGCAQSSRQRDDRPDLR
jgi:hypothetical protein